MATAIRQSTFRVQQERSYVPGLVLMLLALILTAFALLLNSDLTDSFPYFYLIPWITALAVILVIPTVYLYFHGRMTLHDPLVFATWSYIFPAFVIGGLMLAGGWSQPYFLSFIQDANYNLPYTIVLIMLGFAGLAAGYFSPIGRKAGAAVGKFLPKRDFDTSALFIPGLCLLALGTFNTIVALILGVIGYQKSDVVETYSGILFLTTLFWMQGSFLLWYLVFKRGSFDVRSILLMVLLLLTTIGKALFSGNRAALIQVFTSVLLAFLLAGRRLSFKRTVVAGTVLCVCLIAGMIYGTTFRNVKGTENRVSIDQYTGTITETFDQLSSFDLWRNLEFGFASLAERLDTLSSVAVVVSNYEQLQPFEESYGLDNNIWKDLTTFFIPRVFWTDKPVASEARKYSDLYFDYGENSFAITPFGDLVRNYGPVGVPLGMFLFGIVLRFIYRSLVENQPGTAWRAVMYFMLLTSISYEGFYGHLIPYLFKIGTTAVAGLLIVGLVARGLGHYRKAEPV